MKKPIKDFFKLEPTRVKFIIMKWFLKRPEQVLTGSWEQYKRLDFEFVRLLLIDDLIQEKYNSLYYNPYLIKFFRGMPISLDGAKMYYEFNNSPKNFDKIIQNMI